MFYVKMISVYVSDMFEGIRMNAGGITKGVCQLNKYIFAIITTDY